MLFRKLFIAHAKQSVNSLGCRRWTAGIAFTACEGEQASVRLLKGLHTNTFVFFVCGMLPWLLSVDGMVNEYG